MSESIDTLMDEASAALAAMRYLDCERLCLAGLHRARQAGDFETYARIVMPLQESRRQRRQAAVEAGVTVLSGARREPADVLDEHPRGCLLLIDPPYHDADCRAIHSLAMERGLYVEALRMGGEELRSCFEQAMERKGDAALASIATDLSPAQRVDEIAAALDEIGDHELAHQRLVDAAHRAAQESPLNRE